MTKRLVGLLGMALVFTALASASTFAVSCGGTSVSATVGGGTPQSPGLNGTANLCVAWTVPTNFTLTEVDLKIQNDWSAGDPNQTDTLNFTYTIGGFSLSSLTSTVTGVGSSNTPVSFTGSPCSVPGGNDVIVCTDTGLNIIGNGSNQFNAITASILAAWSAGGLAASGGGTGSEEGLWTAVYTYSPTQVVPEPGSLVMIGSGLIGLALAARRKWNA